MFCGNCGEELTGSPRFCIYCGTKPMAGTNFCPWCGTPTVSVTEICIECGARIAKESAGSISPKLRLAVTLLAFFLGIFGAHRFYIGKNETASVMLFFSILGLTILGLATISQLNGGWFLWGLSFIIALEIWAFVDFIFAVTGRMKDNEGRLIQKWRLVVPAREPKYYYIQYTASALRVIAWVILILGLIGSLVWGIVTGGTGGGVWIVIGMIISFLAWLLLLAARELLKLFMDVKGNTRNTAERITRESG
jgi:TM2 domain-containing membrane protein YozV